MERKWFIDIIIAIVIGLVATSCQTYSLKSGDLHSKQSIANAKHYLGRPYDRLYLPDNDAIYCSELVQFSFVNKHGKRLFAPIPMSFHDASGRITDYWIQFYAKHNMEVPEGEPGTNPGELSQRKEIRIKGRLR